MKLIAVEGCTFQVNGVTPGTITITTLPSSKNKLKNISGIMKGVYSGTVQVKLHHCTSGENYVQSADVTGNFIITSTKTKADDKFVLREDDTTGTIIVPMQSNVYPYEITNMNATVKILSAGQTKGFGN